MSRSQGVSLEAIGTVYRQRFGRFLHVASAITGSAEAGADAVQDAFANAVRHRASFRAEAPLEAWLWRLVVNAARKQLTKTPRPSDGPYFGSVSANGHDTASVTEGMRALVAALPERQRLVLFLRYYADLDYQAIASALDIAPGTVASTLSAAHAALRPLIQEEQT
jgi:RNA polymerase sigma-70 factor (ECF subfamily)